MTADLIATCADLLRTRYIFPENAQMAAAMQLIIHTDALIIDLRKNAGGSPDGVQFWCSYFFDDTLTHMNSIFDPTRGTKQFWVLPYLPGDRYTDKPVWVLTSATTFS